MGIVTAVVVVALLFAGFGSELDETVAVFETVVPVAIKAAFTVRRNCALPGAIELMLHVTVEVPEHDHPAGFVMETKLVDGGNVSESVTKAALLGPGLVTTIV